MSIRSASHTLMRRGFSVDYTYASPFKGMGVLVGKTEPNVTSTASEEVNWA